MTMMETTPSNADTYQHVVVRGLPYDRGLSHGRQARAKVQKNVQYYRQPGKLASSQELIDAIIQHVYKPALEQFYPSGFRQGIADGAGVTLDDVVLLNARYYLARLGDEPGCRPLGGDGDGDVDDADDAANECTSAIFHHAATEAGEMLTAQNWDMSARLWEDDCVIYLEVHPDASEQKPALFMLTEAGQLGRSGLNSAGLGVTANSLMATTDFVPYPYVEADGTRHDDVAVRPLLPISMLRRMMLESNHLAEALTCAHNFPRHVSNNVTVSTAEGAGFCLEVTPDRVYKVYRRAADDHYQVHTNHFFHPGFLAHADALCRYPGGSSWFRLDRFEQLVRPHAQAGRLTTQRLVAAFSDHLSFPEALCVHPDRHPVDAVIRHLPGYPFRSNSATVACVIYNLSRSEVTVCKGPPCHGTFQTFQLTGPKGNRLGTPSVGEDIARPEHP